MKLFEFEAKEVLRSRGVQVPRGVLVVRGQSVEARIKEAGLRPPLVVKSQVLVAGRGKAGGIRKVGSVEEAVQVSEELFNKPIKGVIPDALLIEEAINYERELYVAVVIDRSERRPVLLASMYGGMDIEEIARSRPESIVKRYIDPFTGLKPYEARLVGREIGLRGKLLTSFVDFVAKLYDVFSSLDAELVESNPLAVVGDSVIPLDARIIIDDNSLYRQQWLRERRVGQKGELSEWEVKARERGLTFVELEGDIGIIGNGAGLTMATMDLVYQYGGRPANFLDIGGGASAELVKRAVGFLFEYPKAKKIFINIFGGITRGDEVAKGIVGALRELGGAKKPLVVRLSGTREEEGRRILEEAGIQAFTDPIEAVKRVVEL